MTDYPNIVDGLREMVNYSPERMKLIAQRLSETISKSLYSGGNDGEDERFHLQIDLAILTENASIIPAQQFNLHLFEFDKDTCWMLDMTDNDRTDEEIHIPYPATFLDVDVDIRGVRHTGILLMENEGIVVHTKGERDFESVQSIAFTLANAKGQLDPTDVIVKLPHLTAHIFAPTKGFTDPMMPYLVRRYSLLPILQAMELRGVEVGTGEPVVLDFSFGIPNKDRRDEYKAIERIVLNFLDLLDTPDVRIAHIPRKDNSHLRVSRGKIPMPPRERVILTLPIRRYLEEARKGGHLSYNHAFWVRGHFRHYRSDRYAKSGLQGTKEWIPPYVKGKGILVKKKYDVETKFSKL